MKASTLVAVLELHNAIETLSQEIAEEVAAFRIGLKRKGSSTPVYVTEDIADFNIQVEHVRLLCEAVLKGELDSVALSYILNAVQLSQCFALSSESLEDLVARLSDDAEGPATDEAIRMELASLAD